MSTGQTAAQDLDGFSAIADADVLDQVVDAVDAFVDEFVLDLRDESIATTAVGPANVGMVDLALEESAFESYDFDADARLGVNVSRFADVISLADSDGLVSARLDEETRTLELSTGGLDYNLALIDPDSIRDESDLPDLDLTAEVVLEAGDIDRAVKAADMVADHVALGVDADAEQFYVEAEGDTDDVILTLDRDDLLDVEGGDARSLFSLDYLKSVNTAIPNGAEVTLELGKEFPVKMHHDIAEGHGQVTYMIAPRIQSE